MDNPKFKYIYTLAVLAECTVKYPKIRHVLFDSVFLYKVARTLGHELSYEDQLFHNNVAYNRL